MADLKLTFASGPYDRMEALVLRRDVPEKHPWVAPRLYKAFQDAKVLAARQYRGANSQRYMPPWFGADMEEVDELFAGDPWAYGLEANRRRVETLVGYMDEQGFIARRIPLEELFLPVEG